MDIFQVGLFGHRVLSNALETEQRLEKLVQNCLRENEYVVFYVGRSGEFDLLAASVVHRVRRKIGAENSELVLVLPYTTAEYRNNKESFYSYYDSVELCARCREVHFKSAYRVRNREVVDRSDVIFCCLERNTGGVWDVVCYAKKGNKPIIFL